MNKPSWCARSLLLLILFNICQSEITEINLDNKTLTDLCTTADNDPGDCILFSKCQSLYNLITSKPVSKDTVNYLRKSHCGFHESKPKVCCPRNGVHTKNDTLLPGFDVCGIFSEDRIYSGTQAQLDGYPWMALLEYQKPNGHGFHCGGALISKQYVLTAAHCISNIPADWNLLRVRLGEFNTVTDPDCEEYIKDFIDCAPPVIDANIEKKIVHEHYDPNDINRYDDIALLRLREPVPFSDFVKPICLPPAEGQENQDALFHIAGWGANIHSEANGKKQQSIVSTTDNAKCPTVNDEGKKIQPRHDQLCVVESREFQKICRTDDGSPLMTRFPQVTQYGNYFAYGVLSSAQIDCSSRKSAIYTKVSNYLSWIVKNIKP